MIYKNKSACPQPPEQVSPLPTSYQLSCAYAKFLHVMGGIGKQSFKNSTSASPPLDESRAPNWRLSSIPKSKHFPQASPGGSLRSIVHFRPLHSLFSRCLRPHGVPPVREEGRAGCALATCSNRSKLALLAGKTHTPLPSSVQPKCVFFKPSKAG